MTVIKIGYYTKISIKDSTFRDDIMSVWTPSDSVPVYSFRISILSGFNGFSHSIASRDRTNGILFIYSSK